MKKLFFFILLLMSFDAIAKKIHLKPNQGIVVAGVGAYNFKFEEISSGDAFTIKGGRRHKYKYFIVDAGRYYLKSIDPIFKNIQELNFDKPDDTNHSFSVKEGHVTYVGDWLIDTHQEFSYEINWIIERDYSNKYLKKVRRRNKTLRNLPLIISNEVGRSMAVPWSRL